MIGTVLGLIVGYGLSWLGGHYRFIQLDAAVYSIDYLPFAPRVWDAVIVAAVASGGEFDCYACIRVGVRRRCCRRRRCGMSEPRLKYGQLAPEGLAKMRELEHYLNTGTGLEASLRELVRLRVSLMNGCEYCIRSAYGGVEEGE